MIWITYSSPIVLILAIICGGYYYRWLNKSYRFIYSYIIVCLIIDVICRCLFFLSLNNIVLMLYLSLAEVIIFLKFYTNITNKKKASIILSFIGGIYILSEIILIDHNDITNYQPYSKIVSSFLIVLMALTYFLEQLKKETAMMNLYLNSIILIYFALNMVLLLPINFLIDENSELVFYVWRIYLFTTVLFYANLTYLIWKNGRTQKQ